MEHAALGGVLMLAYMAISRIPGALLEVVMPGWVPFLPWLALPYLSQLVVSWFLVLAIEDRALRRAALLACLASMAVTGAVWVLHPTVMYRPPVSGDWWNIPYRVMAAVDKPTNILPCGHILMPVVSGWALARERPRWLWWLAPFQVLGAVAIVTTWQHRPIDLVIGVVVAVAFGTVFGVGRASTASGAG
jgi:hypothetical protein